MRLGRIKSDMPPRQLHKLRAWRMPGFIRNTPSVFKHGRHALAKGGPQELPGASTKK